MCDYCDCRSHPQIASLSADHDVLLELLGGLMRAVEADDHTAAMDIVARLHDLLGGHASREELGVYTALGHAHVASAYVERFEHDHQVIHDLLAQTASVTWKHSARELIRELGEHIAREESDLFPAAHQFLTPRQWDEVDTAVAALGG